MRRQQNSVLPFDIIEIVLSRLPVKSLLRFKTVSKSWNKMISDSEFARIHLDRSKYSNSQKLFLRMSSFRRYGNELFYLIKLEDEKKQLRTLKIMNGPDEDWDKILCFCDGVILLTNYWYRNFVLWNPSTGKHTIFDSPKGFSDSKYGLCHDPRSGGFKVVILDPHCYYVCSANDQFRMKKKEYEEDQIGRKMHGWDVMIRSGVSVDGVVYFLTRYNNGLDIVSERNNDSDIIYFDPRDDKLKILQKPVSVEGNRWFYLTYLGGCLCMYRRGGDRTKIEVWIKGKGRDNNSWKVLMTIENVPYSLVLWFDALCLVENKILVELSMARLQLYSGCGKKFEEIDLEEEYGRHELVSHRDNRLVPYIDSLFHPG